MSKQKIEEAIQFTEDKVNHYAQRMLENADRADRACMGQLNFYISFRNVLKDYQKHKLDRSSLSVSEMRDAPSYRDFGLMEAVNDTLVFMGLFSPTAKFFHTGSDTAAVQASNANTTAVLAFLEDKINYHSSGISENHDRADRAALGQLNFYISFRNVVKLYHRHTIERTPMDVEKMLDMPSYRDFGLVEAVNDSLVFMGMFKPTKQKRKFFQMIEVIK